MDALKTALGAKRTSAPTNGSSPEKKKPRDEADFDEGAVSPDVGVAPDNIGTIIENAPSPNAISDLVKGIMQEHAKETDERTLQTITKAAATMQFEIVAINVKAQKERSPHR
jgi:hypothetical protein